ncbi:coiled-coil and C2 domain-containing protein 2A [Patella vulgata]|uniref:coiled-coil and C2 domain-containing protein 2A n=1 Tax=Patella vulgata TaxID=6465 RepID=UPI0024A94728|nr:coiled-coil and C2 domain-containing protein 2A [Patella vulgata]
MDGKRKRRSKKQPLLENEEGTEDGSSNPAMDSDTETAYQALSHTDGESSAAEILEAGQAETLKKELKTKHRRKLKELSQLRSPQDDLAGEMKTVKKRSRQKLDETAQEEMEAQRAALAASTEDGTVPMPEEETMVDETITTTTRIEEELKIISETVDETVLDKTSTTIDSQADTMEEAKTTGRSLRGASVRERLRSRVQKAKEKADNEILEEEREERKRLRDERSKKSTRFDKDYNEEEMERILEEKSKLLKSRRQKMEDKGEKEMELRGDRLPTEEEAYDFFTRNWDPEPEVTEEQLKEEVKKKQKKEEPKEGTSKEGGEEERAEGEEEKKEGEGDEEDKDKEEEQEEEKEQDESKPEDEQPLLDEFPHDEEGIGPIAFRKSEYISKKKKEDSDNQLLFIPSVISMPASEKVDEEKMPRYLEEEGFYVGVRPVVANRNLNRMENRLLHEPDKGRKWFGEDGRLIALPDPLKKHPSRPAMTDEPEPYLETVFRKAIMRDFDCRYIDGAVDGYGRYQLDVDINSIVFSHHHLFSREHVLATRLSDLYQEYGARKKKNMTEFLSEKVKALKNSAIHLHEYILNHKGEMAVVDRANYEKRLKDYKYDIRQTRLVRDKEEETDRLLIKNIIHTWKELKSLREFQNYNNTPIKLQVIKEETNKAEDQKHWKEEIEEELMEIQEEYEEEFQKKMAIYKEELEMYEKQQAAKKDASKRNKKRRKNKKHTEAEDRDEQIEQMSPEDRELLNEEDLPQPVLPEKFDSKLTRDKIKAKAMAIRRRPGEPKLIPELTSTATVTPTKQCPRGEQSRRDDVSKTNVFVKILFNNKEVSRTPAKPLSQDFRVTFGQIYNLKIVQWPESVKFQIFETRGLGSDLLADLYAGIPDPSVTSQSVQLEEMDFSTDLKIDITHEGVGSGIPFTFDIHGTNTMILMTTGIMCSSVAWSVGEDGTPLVPPMSGYSTNNIYNAMKMMDPVAAIGATGVVNIERLAKWFQESRLDPNDPNNADLVYMLGSRSSSSMQSRDFFRLEQLQQEFDFTTEHELNQNRRFKLLSLRDNEVPEFKNSKMVPVYERELPRDIFMEYERKQREEDRIKHTEDIESHRAAVNRFMQRVREEVMRRFRMAAHQKRLEDVVIEEVVPNIGIVFTRLLQFGEPRRPLKPVRKERKRVTAAAVRGEEVKILLNIIRASCIPIRKSAAGPSKEDGAATRDHDMKIIGNVTLVRPYIEVMFQRNTVRTSVGDGPNPSFNEELELPLKAPNGDFSSNNLQSMSDFVYINLFDEMVVDVQEDDRDRSTNIHQRLEKKWLGNLKIPFSTIYLNTKIVGTFRLNTPPVMLGYTYEDSVRRSDMENVTKMEHSTYISMFLTIEPQLLTPEPVRERFSTNEDEKLLAHSEKWQDELEKRFPKRIYKYSVVDVNGKNMFITRYFKALNIPDDIKAMNLSTDATAERVAHYVSMIPFVSDSAVFHGLCDIWSTCDQFLRMLAGDEEEHAVLLMNYFLELGKKAYLLIGSAVPEGPTAYVLTEEGTQMWLWNASTGEHFNVQDSFCPVQVVGCVMNQNNIWANIQPYEKPVQIDFRFNNTSCWRPIFERSFANPVLGAIQPERLHYIDTDKKHAEDLQEKIEQLLKNKIMDWRSRTLTRWNRHCTKMMRKLLPK